LSPNFGVSLTPSSAASNLKIQVAGERIYVPVRASYNIEHERGDAEEELEFQIKWSVKN
jgi:hypothetical protein